jgi:YggT family protein
VLSCQPTVASAEIELNVLRFLVKTLTDLYLLVFMLRLILQWVRADFYNPFSQFIVTVTNPLILPARRIIPSAGKVDVAAIVVLVILQCLVTWLLLLLLAGNPALDQLLYFVLLRLVSLVIWTYTISIFIYVILSWVAPANYSPIAMSLGQVVEPVLRPVRQIVPSIGGFDLSPLIILILLQAAQIALGLPPALR